MKPTIYDVAKEAKVSIATVSKVINNRGRISEKTKKHVCEVMEQLRYQPSVVASALTGKCTFTIGLLIPDIANPFFAEIARSVEDRGQELGFSVVMCSTDNDSTKEKNTFHFLNKKV
ncbi:LacI family DNA-binding transcriptional regulator [Aneurinibacillus tyrosinisolvens]|uniref:LacI family DNA-binding transcriptional regulator n=1 Tax=Aneurinibacillus tyrosinisolvens TaxID=1443435 RepID=UPI000B1652B3